MTHRHHHSSHDEGWTRFLPKALRPHRRHHHRHHKHNQVNLAGTPNHRIPSTAPAYPKEPIRPNLLLALWTLGVAVAGAGLYWGQSALADSQDWSDATRTFSSLAVIFATLIGLGYTGLLFWRQQLQYQADYRRWERATAKLDRADQRAADSRAQAWHAVKQQLSIAPEQGRHRKRVRSVNHLEISWQEFAQLAANTYTQLGYTVGSLSKQGVDGLDWRITNPAGEVACVLCRYWQAPMDDAQIANWLKAATALGAGHLTIWAMKGFTQPAWDTYEQSPTVSLLDPHAIDQLIEEAYGAEREGVQIKSPTDVPI